MRNIQFYPGGYFHIFNRGNKKNETFLDDADYLRFLFMLLTFQSARSIPQSSRYVHEWIKEYREGRSITVGRILSTQDVDAIVQTSIVRLVSFALMPNHFHFLLQEKREGGISAFLQRLLNGYTKYFNARYKQVGHVFQGPFQAVSVTSDEQLLYLSAYIHQNPHEINQWRGRAHQYPWSSFQDYAGTNRWGQLMDHRIVTQQLHNVGAKSYRDFVQRTGAKQSTIGPKD